MATTKVKKSEEELELEDRAEIETDIDNAMEAAKLIFGVAEGEKPNTKMVMGLLDRLDGYDDDAKAIVCEQLTKSVEICKAKFGSMDVEAVFSIYDLFYEEDDTE